MSTPYYHVRFRWWQPQDLDAAVGELSNIYDVTKKIMPKDDAELTLYASQRDEVTAKADTLAVIMSPYRAVLYQRNRRPFTSRDVSLRAWVFEKYNKSTSTPFPFGGNSEPKYEIVTEDT